MKVFTLFCLAAVSCLAQTKPVPRMPNGKPDLSGVWDHPRVSDISKDYNGRCAGGTPGCSSIGAHDLDTTLTPFGKAENAKPKFDYGLHCLPCGSVPPWATPDPGEIFQPPHKSPRLFQPNKH